MIKTIIFDLGNVIVKVNWDNFYKKAIVKSDKPLKYIKKYCKKVIWLDEGEIKMNGNNKEVINAYLKEN